MNNLEKNISTEWLKNISSDKNITLSSNNFEKISVFNIIIATIGHYLKYYAIYNLSPLFYSILSYFGIITAFIYGIIINNDNTRTPDHPVLTNPKVKLVDFGQNIFVNPAWNYGVQNSSNTIVCILNDDLIFDLKLFYKMAEFVTPEMGVVGKLAGDATLGQTVLTNGEINIDNCLFSLCELILFIVF